MGAGAKSDPTRIQIADISQTTYDPLARAVRRKLRVGTPSVTEGTLRPHVPQAGSPRTYIHRVRHSRRLQHRNTFVRHRSPPAPTRRVREGQSTRARAL